MIPVIINWAIFCETYDVHNHSILHRTDKTLEKFILGNHVPEICGPIKRLCISVLCICVLRIYVLDTDRKNLGMQGMVRCRGGLYEKRSWAAPCQIHPFPAGSKRGIPQDTVETIRKAGGRLWKSYLRKSKKL